MKTMVLIAALLTLAAGGAGCGTVMTSSVGDFSPFSGSKIDRYALESPISSPGERALAFLDMPFSIVADTILLAVSIPVTMDRLYAPIVPVDY
jgi:uncharacterized protein YceK